MRSIPAIDVPPNFITMRGMGGGRDLGSRGASCYGAGMADATTVDAREAAHFGRLAADWWDPHGTSAPLHRLNPPRLAYLRNAVDAHWGADPRGFAPLAGRRALDLG